MNSDVKKPLGLTNYLMKSQKWYLGNLCFGLLPLILMGFANTISNGKACGAIIEHLILEGGVIFFVCLALMGAVIVDYLLSGVPSRGRQIFTIYIFPLCIAGLVSIAFLLKSVDLVEKDLFCMGSRFTLFIFFLSFLYCTFTKANLYLKEETEPLRAALKEAQIYEPVIDSEHNVPLDHANDQNEDIK